MSISAGTSMLLQLTSVAFLLAVQASVALRLAPLLALGTLVPAALLAFALRGQIRRILELGRAANSSHEAVFHEMSEFLGGMKLAKSAAAEGPHVAACVSAAARLRAQQLHYIRAKSGAHMAYQIGGALAMVLLVVLGSTVSELPLPELLVLGAVFSRMVPVVLDCVSQIQAVAHSLPAFASVESIIRECQSAAEEEDAGRPAPTLGAELALHGVSFRYEPAGPDVLRDVSLTIRAGGMLAVTGPSGAGKSTLADLVMGLLHPTQGLLTIDGAPLLRAEARAWRRSLAYVSQESFLFRDSVRANLLWARPDATEKDLWHALSLAAAAGFVTALPRGLDTMIGDRGLLLSGGERQRLAIARAVLRRPQLLVLDEATSALDYENERLVQAAIDGLRGLTTILVITHRLMALRGADEVLVLVEGRTAERGEWQSLVEGGGWLATTLGPGESRLAPTYPP
jgi:ATP-binding cassette subfamily C protein